MREIASGSNEFNGGKLNIETLRELIEIFEDGLEWPVAVMISFLLHFVFAFVLNGSFENHVRLNTLNLLLFLAE